ncbi:hypothetical protein [Methylophaga sp. OBS4]|uniref:hypothetical protein n=1 Tax=Methylophaga sp. OBS4 TaxID=2991935 RepID=UPI0022511CF0|nr:hypothetical protein [Methylophaga sp. OBS4]MCX4186756.1 hypothetical protein [Methylophaga sp. OBS4]
MYGHPADREFANQCLALWGRRQRYGGPQAYPREANFVPKARGIPVDWHDNITETVGFVVVHCMTAEESRLVKMYYQPYPDRMKANEPVTCNRSFVLRRCREEGIRMSRHQFDDVIGCAIGKVAMALAYPSMLAEPPEELVVEKKVCNLRK